MKITNTENSIIGSAHALMNAMQQIAETLCECRDTHGVYRMVGRIRTIERMVRDIEREPSI